ncbi:hypothetical protein ACS0TY_013820 [Phlomoides rotata]
MGLNEGNESLSIMVEILGCEVGQIPFPYMGLNVGVNHQRSTSWDKLVNKIRRRLALWNDKHISWWWWGE